MSRLSPTSERLSLAYDFNAITNNLEYNINLLLKILR